MTSLLLGAALVLAVMAHVMWLLPRLSSLHALVTGGGVTALLLLAAALTPWPMAFGAAALTLVASHLGWYRGHTAAAPRAVALPVTMLAPQPPVPKPAATPAVDNSKPLVSGSTLGRYRIEHELGRGSMGVVYLGSDPKIGRSVAIKTMALGKEFHGHELAEARQRFFREAETAGRLQHPDIVTIFDAGEAHELAYIAMELLKGDDLQQHTLPATLLPVADVVNITARVADALAYAHSQGVVHRDIKPANVMVDLPADAVKVTDFGIARITDSSRTRTGMVLGTPSFMSPEQMAGRRVDGRSDLYSLGVMLYQLLTGDLPHRADSMATLLYEIANATAPDVRNRRPEVPEALAKVVARLLEKRPEQRHADGKQLAVELRAIGNSLPLLQHSIPSVSAANDTRPPSSSGFEATVKFERTDPGHNRGH
jgi:eukaryotic-like serine/threonine-protein kinase